MLNFSRSIISRFYSIKMELFKTIGTHDGVFHCDEILGCAMLRIICPNAKIIRTRDVEKLSQCDIVIDVGGVFDVEKFRFDHHQKDFNKTMHSLLPDKPWTIKLSSAGLIYCYYGKNILRTLKNDLNDCDLESIYDKLYESFIQEIDGIDNGIPMCTGEMLYNIHTSLSSRVRNLNKRWNHDEFNEAEAFNKALVMVSNEFQDKVDYFVNEWLPAKDIVLAAIQDRYKVHSSGKIIQLSKNCPWKTHLFSLEKELNIEDQIKFVLFETNGVWRVQAVSLDETSFILRTPLYEPWRGLREDELQKKSNIEGAIFVHSNGFIGGNRTRDGAREMAIQTLNNV